MKDIALDACTLINLVAADLILKTATGPESKPGIKYPHRLDVTLHVPAIVARESLYILQPDVDDSSKLIRSPIDLASHYATGALHACDLTGHEEIELYVQYATRLDDGEAACLAIAKSQKWTLATDDRLASRLADESDIPVVTTAELVRQWARKSRASKRAIATLVMNIRRYAKFIPRSNSPEAEWWYSHLPKS